MKETDNSFKEFNTINQLAIVFQASPATIYRILRSTGETKSKERTEDAENDPFDIIKNNPGSSGRKQGLRNRSLRQTLYNLPRKPFRE